MHRFSGRVALVSGGGSGIGKAIAERLADEGADVVRADIAATDVECDVTSPDACRAAVAATLDRHGRLDILCNVAGIGIAHPIGSFPIEDWRRIFDVNVHGSFHLSQAALPALLASTGCIVNLASVSALRGSPYNAAYSASKAALVSLTRSMAVELASQGVRVNAVAPSAVDTPFLTGFSLPDEADLALVGRAAPPMPGLVDPADVATAVAYLASDDARSMTGAVLVLDRGASA